MIIWIYICDKEGFALRRFRVSTGALWGTRGIMGSNPAHNLCHVTLRQSLQSLSNVNCQINEKFDLNNLKIKKDVECYDINHIIGEFFGHVKK